MQIIAVMNDSVPSFVQAVAGRGARAAAPGKGVRAATGLACADASEKDAKLAQKLGQLQPA
jgi:hypothetical protein